METTRIFIVDDHRLFIDGLMAIMRTAPSIKVIGSAEDGGKALDIINSEVQLVITDISMPVLNGYEFTRKLKERYPAVKVLCLSMHNDIDNINRMLQAGADGYVLKNTGRNELLKAIATIMSGERYFSVEVQNEMLYAYVSKTKPDKKQEPGKEPYVASLNFTRREKEIMKLIKQGLTSQDIADRLILSVNTVNSHRKNIYAKTRVSNTAQLIDFIDKNNINL